MDESPDKLDFHQAMGDFRTMFPNFDQETIEAVLRANEGAVDDTIDQLLAMMVLDGTNPQNLSSCDKIPSYQEACNASTHSKAQLKMDPASADALLLDFLDCPGSSTLPSTYQQQIQRKKSFKPPLVGKLPKDFLRPDYDPRTHTTSEQNTKKSSGSTQHDNPAWNETRSKTMVPKKNNFVPQYASLGIFTTRPYAGFGSSSSSGNSKQNAAVEAALAKQGDIFKERMAENEWRRQLNKDPELERYLEDERFALMMQNEEFLRHLQNDPDFLAALEKDQKKKKSKSKKLMSTSIDGPNISSAQSAANEVLIDEADPFPYTKYLPKPETNDVAFSEKLKFMSKNSKRKFAILAQKFVKKKKGAKGIIGNSDSNYSNVGLLHNTDSDALLHDQDDSDDDKNNMGYNQASDSSYNIGRNKDLKEGRLFSTYR